MHTFHPYRYHAAFRSQLEQLERLSRGVTAGGECRSPSAQLIGSETVGATIAEIAARNLRLQHLDVLIADWHLDREAILFPRIDDLDGPAQPTTVGLDRVPAAVCYVSLEARPSLRLARRPQARIEGFYAREIVTGGKFCAEITIVCDEPGWDAMGTCSDCDAMEIGSRIAVGVIPLEERLELATARRLSVGNPSLVEEPALPQTIAMAEACLASMVGRGQTPSLSLRRPN